MPANTDFVAGQVLTAAQMDNLPFGVVARVSTTPAQTATAVVDMTGVTVTWTPPSTSRIYLVIAQLEIFNSNADSIASVQLTNAANTVLQSQEFFIPPAGTQSCTAITWVETGLSGSTTRKIRFGRGFGNTGDVVTFGDQQLTVIDIGAA